MRGKWVWGHFTILNEAVPHSMKCELEVKRDSPASVLTSLHTYIHTHESSSVPGVLVWGALALSIMYRGTGCTKKEGGEHHHSIVEHHYSMHVFTGVTPPPPSQIPGAPALCPHAWWCFAPLAFILQWATSSSSFRWSPLSWPVIDGRVNYYHTWCLPCILSSKGQLHLLISLYCHDAESALCHKRAWVTRTAMQCNSVLDGWMDGWLRPTLTTTVL